MKVFGDSSPFRLLCHAHFWMSPSLGSEHVHNRFPLSNLYSAGRDNTLRVESDGRALMWMIQVRAQRIKQALFAVVVFVCHP